MSIEINKQAVQRVHEQIFGQTFSPYNDKYWDYSSPKVQPRKPVFSFPEFKPRDGYSFTIDICKKQYGKQPGFIFEQDKAGRIVIRLQDFGTLFGILPGDNVISVNGVECKGQNVFNLNEKLKGDVPETLSFLVTPCPDSTEWSFRVVGFETSANLRSLAPYSILNGDNCSIGSAKTMVVTKGCAGSICTRSFVTKSGNFSLLGKHIKEIYISMLTDISSEEGDLLSKGDIVIVSHRDGYTSGSIVERIPDDAFRVSLWPSKQLLSVPASDVHKANSGVKQGVEDLMLLPQLSEPCLVYNLQARLLTSQPYTYAGDFAMLAFNPMSHLDVYNDVVKHLFYGCQHRLDMPPHIYSVAQSALARLDREANTNVRPRGAMETTHRVAKTTNTSATACTSPPTQAICLLGRSGAGKSSNAEHLLEYVFSRRSNISALTIRAIVCLLDAFTCSRTLINSNASRCLRLFTVEFSADGGGSGDGGVSIHLNASRLIVDLLMLDKFRVTRRPQGEPTFNIFYYFLSGLEDNFRRKFMLEDLSSPNLFMTPLQRPEDQSLAKARWEAVHAAAVALGAPFEEAFMDGVCRILAAIYHLGCAGATPPSSTAATVSPGQQCPPRRCFINLSAAERAAHLLGCVSVEALIDDVFNCDGAGGDATRAPSSCSCISRSGTPTHRQEDDWWASTEGVRKEAPSNLDLLGSFVANLFAIATNALRDLINKALNPSMDSTLTKTTASSQTPSPLTSSAAGATTGAPNGRSAGRLLIIDPPGLQTPEAGGRLSGGSFEDLLYNYVNECLLQFYRECQSSVDSSGNINVNEFEFVSFLDEPPSDQPLLTRAPSGGSQRGQIGATPDVAADDDADELTTTATTWNCSTVSMTANTAGTGLLWLVDYACTTGDFTTFLRLLAQKYTAHKRVFDARDSRVMRRLHRSGAFSLNHWNCTAVVQYHPATWLPSCHYKNSPRDVIGLLQRSSLPALRRIGDSMDEGASASALSVSSCSRIVESFILDSKYVIDLLRSCCLGGGDSGSVSSEEAVGNISWVHCLLPVASAGLWQTNPAATPHATADVGASTAGASVALPRLVGNPNARFCVPLVRAQLHGLCLSTDLGYLRPAFVERLRRPTDVLSSMPDNQALESQPPTTTSPQFCTTARINTDSISPTTYGNTDDDCDGDLTTITEPHTSSGVTALQTSSTPLPLHSNNSSEGDKAAAGASETFNFVFNSSNNTFPWEQLIAMAPVDRGLIKQLRLQLEELEETRDSLMRKQRTLQTDLDEMQQQLHEEQREKHTIELRCQTSNRVNAGLQSRVEELEEELEEAKNKNRRSSFGVSSNSPGFNCYDEEITQFLNERNAMREEIADLQTRIATAASEKAGAADMEVVYLKAKVHELDGRLELETSTKVRLQSNVERLKTQLQQLTSERDGLLSTLQNERQTIRQLSRSHREAREDKERAVRRLAELEQRRPETSNDVSSCVQEQLRLRQELSQLILRRKEEELRSLGMRPKASGLISSHDEDSEDTESEDLGVVESVNSTCDVVHSTQELVSPPRHTDVSSTNGLHREEATRNGDKGPLNNEFNFL